MNLFWFIIVLLSIKLLIFINKGTLWNQKRPIYTVNSYIQHKIIQEHKVRGTITHFTLVMAFPKSTGLSNNSVVIIHNQKLRGHHPFCKTVWRMAQYQQPNWKIGWSKLNLRWNFSLTYGLSTFPVFSGLLQCDLLSSKDHLPGGKVRLFRLQLCLHSWKIRLDSWSHIYMTSHIGKFDS